MDSKVYTFGGVRVIDIENDELFNLEIYAPNAQDYNQDNGVDPCGGAMGPCGAVFT